jgi:hypothetical protein
LDSDDSYRRATLRRVEDDVLRATGNRIERMVALDRSGRMLLVKDGSETQVRLTLSDIARLLVRRPYLLTHNHRHGTAPSDADVCLAVAAGAVEVNSFSTDVRWRIQRGVAGWPPRQEIIGRFRTTFAAKRASVYDLGVREILGTGGQPTAADYRRLWGDTLEAIWRDLTVSDPMHWAFWKEMRQ